MTEQFFLTVGQNNFGNKIPINAYKFFAAKIVPVDMKRSTGHAITGRAILLGNATAILIFAILAI